ncbi:MULTISPECIES: flagellar filament capping protein FliD [Marinobacterium]|uniref:Flagellar hook-associated protein 2 n=2 Tax=Marinobacterium TaxID=48075 RepID=A0A1H6BE90_9GAMM|nr:MULTISPECIES: flagellar filament capping protein FliD [Marinobacterium]TCK07051.1 flagellar hook-associated protein 2 [Marinobacterium mangrovicola]SEG58556.1 flagellar hook-associated protein 2 [Marinobacterium lutimaris]
MANNIISSLGGGSGIDTVNLVTSLVEAERAPQEQRIDRKSEELSAQISAYGTLKSALSDFQSMLSPLANPNTFSARSVAFPETDLITPDSLDPGAQTGSYQIEVLDVASAQTLVMGSNSDANAALGGSGTLDIQFGTWTYAGTDPDSFAANADKPALSIEIQESDSLEDIADKINGTDSGIQASVMRVGDQYQLMLSSPSGEANALSVTGNDDGTGSAPALLQGFNFNQSGQSASVTETQQASDAVLKVNGLEIRRESNKMTDVIEGFNFTVNKASVGEKINFSVEADSSVAEQAIRDFVDAYNAFQEVAENLTGYSRDEENVLVRGDLASDSSAKSLVRQLRSSLTSEVAGLESGFTALTNLGIRTERDGTLSIEESEFSSAISNNFDEVADLFARKTSSENGYVEVGMGTRIGATQPGKYEVEVTQDAAKGYLTGEAFDAATLFGGGPIDASAGDYSFRVNVNGTISSIIQLSGTYANAEELRSDLQSQINGDDNIKGVNAAVDVRFDEATGQFSFESREFGQDSKVTLSLQGADMASIGLGATSAITAENGQDVKGTINGVAAFGSGNVLLPELSSDAYGLNLTVSPGAAGTGPFDISFSRGVAGTMDSLLSRFMSNEGVIALREENMSNQLDGLEEDRDELDRRMERYEARLSAQFLAMEQIVSSLNDTGDSLEGLLDRLPFTAQN